MKKRFLISGLCLAIGLSTMLASCGKPDTKGIISAQDAYGFGAVSTIRLLGSETSVAAINSLSLASQKVAQATDSNISDMGIKQQIGKFNEYFTALDSFLSKDVVSTTTETNTDASIPYQTKLTIKGKDFNGNDTEYVMYYTETFLNETVEDDESEKTYKLTGIMVVDGENYHLEGERSQELESDESEHELKIRAYKDLTNKSTYVEMEQENSQELDESESEYMYSVYVNGTLIEQTEVEFGVENENNKVETEYELRFINGTGKGEYSIERVEQNGVSGITVEYNLNGERGKFTVRDVTTNNEKQYEYTFADGTSMTL